MTKTLLSTLTSLLFTVACFQTAISQNTAPYWSLAGNSNATTSSKLGTTNGVSLRFFAGNVQRMMIGYGSGNVSIGTTSLNARLTVNAASASDALLGQINGTTKLRLASNGGLSIGASTTPPSNGLYVAGRGRFITGATIDDGGLVVNRNDIEDEVYEPAIAVNATGEAAVGLDVRSENMGIYVSSDQTGMDVNGNLGLSASGNYLGIYASARPGGRAVFGYVRNGSALAAQADSGNGVYATGDTAVYGSGKVYGIRGIGKQGVYGTTTIATGDALAGSASGTTAYGLSAFSASSFGVYGATGNAASYAGYFSGSVYTTGSYVGSDRSLKEDINDVGNALDLLRKLKPKSYSFRQDGAFKTMNLPEGKHYGFIAQEVEQVLPMLVKATTFDAGKAAANGSNEAQTAREISFKALNYTELIPILVKAIQEQQQENEELKARLQKLEAALAKITGNGGLTVSGTLGQNTPNPARSSTRIAYQIPSGSRAQLRLSDAAGKTVKVMALNASTGFTDVNTTGLSSGVYSYSLIVDGKIAETKKLTVTR